MRARSALSPPGSFSCATAAPCPSAWRPPCSVPSSLGALLDQIIVFVLARVFHLRSPSGRNCSPRAPLAVMLEHLPVCRGSAPSHLTRSYPVAPLPLAPSNTFPILMLEHAHWWGSAPSHQIRPSLWILLHCFCRQPSFVYSFHCHPLAPLAWRLTIP